MMGPLVWVALLLSTSCAAFGQILLKLGAQDRSDALALVNWRLLSGLGLYAIGMALWLYALTRLPLIAVYPFTTLTLVLVGILSAVVLGERPGAIAICGWAIIVVGVGVVWIGARA